MSEKVFKAETLKGIVGLALLGIVVSITACASRPPLSPAETFRGIGCLACVTEDGEPCDIGNFVEADRERVSVLVSQVRRVPRKNNCRADGLLGSCSSGNIHLPYDTTQTAFAANGAAISTRSRIFGQYLILSEATDYLILVERRESADRRVQPMINVACTLAPDDAQTVRFRLAT